MRSYPEAPERRRELMRASRATTTLRLARGAELEWRTSPVLLIEISDDASLQVIDRRDDLHLSGAD